MSWCVAEIKTSGKIHSWNTHPMTNGTGLGIRDTKNNKNKQSPWCHEAYVLEEIDVKQIKNLEINKWTKVYITLNCNKCSLRKRLITVWITFTWGGSALGRFFPMKLLLIPPIVLQNNTHLKGKKTEVKPPTKAPSLVSVRTGVHTLIVWFAPKAVPILSAPAPSVAEEPVYVQNVFPFTTGQDLNITAYR